MQHLYAPWRKAYFDSRPDGCVFCHVSKNEKDDEQNMLLFRDSLCFAVMNLYPYTPGHFMIIPYEHVGAIEELDGKTWQQMSKHVRSGVKMLKEHWGAKGVNIGMNLGDLAGAGIAEHVHYHLVPRKFKDTNFISTIGDSRVHGLDFKEVYESLKSAVPKYFSLELGFE